MDLKNLSNQELNELRKAVLEEIGNREPHSKASVEINRSLWDIFRTRIDAKNLGENPGRVMLDMERAIFKLCDITLANYKFTKAKGRNERDIQVNGKIYCNLGRYKAMSNELLSVVEKYAGDK
jgi:hypothetical protein